MMTLQSKRNKTTVGERTVYMEMIGKNRICCRVISGLVSDGADTYDIYGVELEMKLGPVRFKEEIEDFSTDVDEAAEFAGMLVKNGVKPSEIYDAALVYLGSKIGY